MFVFYIKALISQLTVYVNLKSVLTDILVEQLRIIAVKYPSIFYLLGELIAILGICINIRNFYIEYITVLKCISFIIYMFCYNTTNLDLFACLWLLDNISSLYLVCIKYIYPSFKYSYPRIHKLLYNLSTVLFYINMFNLIYFVFMGSKQPKPLSGSGGGGPSGNGGSGGPTFKVIKRPKKDYNESIKVPNPVKWHAQVCTLNRRDKVLNFYTEKFNNYIKKPTLTTNDVKEIKKMTGKMVGKNTLWKSNDNEYGKRFNYIEKEV